MYCNNCGKEIVSESNFCMHCGNKINADYLALNECCYRRSFSYCRVWPLRRRRGLHTRAKQRKISKLWFMYRG